MCGLRLVVHTAKHSNFGVQNYSVYRMGLLNKFWSDVPQNSFKLELSRFTKSESDFREGVQYADRLHTGGKIPNIVL